MDWGFSWERDRRGTKGSWRRRSSGSARAGRYEVCWNHGIDKQRARKTLEEMMVAIGDSVSDLASSDNGDDGDDEHDEKTEQGKLSEDDEPGWVMGTINNPVQQCTERIWQKQMQLDELPQLGWEDAAEYFRGRDKKYGTSKFRVPAIIQPHTDDGAAAPAPTNLGDHIESLKIVPRITQMPQTTSRPGSSHIRRGSVKPQSNTSISGHEPGAERYTSPLLNAKPVETSSFYPWI